MEELLAEYFFIKKEMDSQSKRLESIREKIKYGLKQTNLEKYENKEFKITLSKSKRTTINKNDVPTDIWEKYSVCTPFEMLQIKKKQAKKSRTKKE